MGRHARPSVGISRAALLTITAQCLGYRARHEDALPLYRAAVEDGGEVSPDARVWLADGLLEVGDADAARALFEEVLKDRPTDPYAYQPGPTMLVYTAEPASPTTDALDLLASWAATESSTPARLRDASRMPES